MQELNISPNTENKKKTIVIIVASIVILILIGIYFYKKYNTTNKSMSDQDKFLYLESLRNQLNSGNTTPEQKQAIIFFLQKQQEAIDANSGGISEEDIIKNKNSLLNNIK